MVNINKSFIYGMFFASITWMISLCLYMNLSNSEPGTSTPIVVTEGSPDKRHNLEAVVKKPNFTNKHESELFDLGLVRTAEEQRIKDDGYKKHAFNVLISNRLDYHRSIPDTRHHLCGTQTYDPDLPNASIIICFYNEHLQTLLRTIHSILDRTPGNLLQEILLIDDFSDMDQLHENLANCTSNMSKVRLIRTEQREGLIRARMLGARHAAGEVLVFLDSHVEVNVNWIQPLLARIKENVENVVMPIIDIINADTFVYTASPLVRGGFNWGLHFKWDNLPKGILSTSADFVKPIKSPTMAGGLFGIDRKYFFKMGQYDAGMNIWGGENLEISFRIWMCGGNLEIIPCSRVGHVFRQRRPYGSPQGEDTMLYNSLRVAQVWMDDYKENFFNQRPDARRLDAGDLSDRQSLRTTLNCHNFTWYLENIYPELTLPSDTPERLRKKWAALEPDTKYQPWHMRKRNYVSQYQIRLSNSTLCVQSGKDMKTKGSRLVLRPCVRQSAQIWHETDRNELVLGQLLCLQAGKNGVMLWKCHEMGADQEWRHKGEINSAIYNIASGTCLAAESNHVNALITMKLCSEERFTHFDIVQVKESRLDRYKPFNRGL